MPEEPRASSSSRAVPQASKEGSGGDSQLHPLLKSIMSNPANTLQEIERQQHGEMAVDIYRRHPLPGFSNGFSSGPAQCNLTEPESPNTALKRTLNILPQTALNKTVMPSQSAPVMCTSSAVSEGMPLMAPPTPGGATVSSTSHSSSGVIFSLCNSGGQSG